MHDVLQTTGTVAVVLSANAQPVVYAVPDPLGPLLAIGNEEFRDAGQGDWLGFYDWLRTKAGEVIGVRLWVDDVNAQIRALHPCAGVVAGETCFPLLIYFGEERAFEEQLSDDQDFGSNRLLVGPGKFALTFNAPSKRVAADSVAPPAVASGTPGRLRAAVRLLVSLLLGGVAILGAMLVFRQGLLPLIEALFHPAPELLSVLRRSGILATALAGYWAFVHWHEKRAAPELRLRPMQVLLGGAGGAAMVALPMALLFALGVYEMLLWRGASSALFGIAAVIGIAATLEELVYRCLLFQLLERAWGTQRALVVQALVFALQHLGNVAQGGIGDVAAMLVAVTVLGLLWGGVFMLTRNLWVAAAHHAAWNFTILLSGLPLSGIEDWRLSAPLESRMAGPDWLSGGMFGPESSLLVIVSTTAVAVLLLRAASRRGAFFAPAPHRAS